jgi:hypothetical protein
VKENTIADERNIQVLGIILSSMVVNASVQTGDCTVDIFSLGPLVNVE